MIIDNVFLVKTWASLFPDLPVGINVSFLWQDTNPSGAPCLTSGFYANSIVVFVVFYLVFLSIDGQQFHQYQQSEQPPLMSNH